MGARRACFDSIDRPVSAAVCKCENIAVVVVVVVVAMVMMMVMVVVVVHDGWLGAPTVWNGGREDFYPSTYGGNMVWW